MESDFPTYTFLFKGTGETDSSRINLLQDDSGCDGVIISRYSISFIATENDNCKVLYPLYDEELFVQDIVIPVSQTLGDLGDELIRIFNVMIEKDLYINAHNNARTALGSECKFDALGEPDGVVEESFYTPLIFSVSLAGISLIIGFVWKSRRRVEPMNSNAMKEELESLQCENQTSDKQEA